MRIKLKPLAEQVVVITGASSGIGLATAKAAAAGGARVVLCARSGDALDEAVDQITAAGGEAIAVGADVGSRAELEAVAARAVERFGGFDTWVNNAGVGIWGRIEEVSEADMRRLFDTNVWGVVNGSLVALAHLKEQGGAIINVGSLTSDQAIPLQGIYSASKHAMKGFTDALRMELRAERAPVSVTLIKPASIGTPMAQHVRNYTGLEAKLPPPLYSPDEVARTILTAAVQPVREAYVGGSGRLIGSISAAFPRLFEAVGATVLMPQQVRTVSATSGDNLHSGMAEARTLGRHPGRVIRPSIYSRAVRNPGTTLAIAGAAAGAAAFLLSGRGRGEEPAGTRRRPARSDLP